MIKKIFWLILILIITLFTTRVYFNDRFPYTHDGENHLARFANYKIAFKEGQIPPRFAPNLVNRYGYPVFNYNYPLANITSLPFSILKINYEIIFKILVISSVFLGLVGIFKWLEKLNFDKRSSLFAVFVFSLSPFLTNLIYFRGNIGEIMALSIIPWLLFFTETHKKGLITQPWKKTLLCILWAAFFLAHNITALFGTAYILLYFLIRFWSDFKNKKSLRKALTYLFFIIIGFFLSTWFWIPAILEKSEIILDTSASFDQYLLHFPTLSQLLFSQAEFGFSYASSIDTMSFSLGLAQIFSIVFVSTVLIKSKYLFSKSKFSKKQNIVIALLVLSFLTAIFQLSFTQPVWTLAIVSKYIQFPWRLGLFFAISVLPVAAYLFEYLSKKWRILFIFIVLIQITSHLRLKPADYFHRFNRDYDAFTQTTSSQNENLPKTFTYLDLGNWQPTPEILEGNGEITVHNWNGSKRNYLIKTSERVTVVEPTMYFLGWETVINGEKVVYDISESSQGRISYILNPKNGEEEYSVETIFTQKTPARIIGNTISILTFIILTTYLIISTYKDRLIKN